MQPQTKRTYNSESRQIQAEKTKNRILVSAKQLFESIGFDKVTIEEIAQHAKVSISTVYSLFQSKTGVLRSLMDDALSSEHYQVLVQRIKAEQSPSKRLELAAIISRKLYDAEKAQLGLLQSASILAPEFKKLENEREKRRYKRQAASINEISKEQVFAKGLSVSKVKDILWAFTGRDLYRMLVVERGWSSDEYEKWLTRLLIQTLLKKSVVENDFSDIG
jgi:AcrR family transcriptional regulator